MAEYRELKLGNITVYVHESLERYDELEIDALKLVFWNKLVLRGIPQQSNGCCG